MTAITRLLRCTAPADVSIRLDSRLTAPLAAFFGTSSDDVDSITRAEYLPRDFFFLDLMNQRQGRAGRAQRVRDQVLRWEISNPLWYVLFDELSDNKPRDGRSGYSEHPDVFDRHRSVG
jgi:hypothetical protein